MARIISVYMTGNSPKDTLSGFIWHDQDDAAIHARENNERFVYEVQTHIYTEDLTVVNDLDYSDEDLTD